MREGDRHGECGAMLNSIDPEFWRLVPYFNAVAARGGITHAADALRTTPPTVSKAIKRIEGLIGLELFRREGNYLRLTRDGHELFRLTEDWRAQSDEFLLSKSVEQHKGSITIGAMGHLDSWLILPCLQQLQREYPDLTGSVHHPTDGDAADGLRRRRYDFFVGLNVIAPGDISVETLARPSTGFYVGRGHPLFGCESTTLDEVLEYGFVVQEALPLIRPMWPKELRRKVALFVDNHLVGLNALFSGEYVAVVLDIEMKNQRANADFFRLPLELDLGLEIVACRETKPPLAGAYARFLELLIAACDEAIEASGSSVSWAY